MLIFDGVYIRRGLYTEGNLRYKIDGASLQLKGNLCVIVRFLLCFILDSRVISKYKAPGAYIQRGDLTEVLVQCFEVVNRMTT